MSAAHARVTAALDARLKQYALDCEPLDPSDLARTALDAVAVCIVSNLGYRCKSCRAETSLSDLNSDMLCTSCGEPDEDPEYLSPSAAYLRRWESTWSV